MNIRMWGISLFMFLSTVSAVGQTANRYLKAPLPDEWEESGQVFQQTLPVDDYWWKSFRDTKLDSLIALAVDRNFSVAMAINRISAARANLWMERSNFFPSIGLNAGWTREETSGNISAAPQSTEHYYGASLSMSWEVDVFGSIRKRVKAQKENFAASKEYVEKFEAAMEDDANTADAVSAVFELVKFINVNSSEQNSKEYLQALYQRLETLCDVLGIIIEKKEEILDSDIEALIAERQAARKEKNFARADEIRDMLLEQGIILEDTREGVKWKRA